MVNVDELERRAIEARQAGRQVVLSPDEVEGVTYWLRSLLRQREHWSRLHMMRRGYRLRTWLRTLAS